MRFHQSTTTRTAFVPVIVSIILLLSIPATDRAMGTGSRRKAPDRIRQMKRKQAKASDEAAASGLKTYALRLRPGQDLRTELESFTKRRGIRAGFILTAVGSLQKASLRLADRTDATSFTEKFEIVSLVGTLSPEGVHLHLSLSDGNGKTIGGHLVAGCAIYTTAEIVIGELKGVRFTREQDSETGYKELRIRQQ